MTAGNSTTEQTETPEEPRRLPRMRWLVATSLTVICVVVISTVASVNLFPVLTNDSLTYLAYGGDLGGFGFVQLGYRQFGYPLFLWLTESVATGVLSIEPLLFASFAQRLGLLVGVVYAVWLWRWWAVPVVVVAVSAELLSYSNLILTEGVSIPLSLILVCATGHYLAIAGGSDVLTGRLPSRVVGGVMVFAALALVAIRFPFAVFGICPLVAVLATRKTSLARDGLALFGLYVVGAALIVGLISAENNAEFGEFSPSTRGARSEYWAAWATTFLLDPANASDPHLAEFYGTGDPYDFIAEVDSLDVPYSEQAAIYQQNIDDMVVAAGTGVWGSRGWAFLGALRGGRLNDLRGIVETIESSDRVTVDQVVHSNVYSRLNGFEAFADTYNDGMNPEVVITSPLGERFPLPTAYALIAVLLPLSLMVCSAALLSRDARLLAAAGLAAVIAFSVLIAYIRADNFRFLVTTSVFGIGAACGSLAAWRNGQRDAPLALAPVPVEVGE